jgi:ADP-heptose:LPS heptosyltransferase
MLPEWQEVSRLLLCSHEHGDISIWLTPSLEMLHRDLPNANTHLLVLQDKCYKFFKVDSQSKDSFQLLGSNYCCDYAQLIEMIREFSFDASIIFTHPLESPFSLGYLSYLAGIPIRLGQSQEFGGGVLSHCVKPLIEPVSPAEYNLHLLESAGFSWFEGFAIA